MNPECIFYANSTLLEGPCWDPKRSVLYFVSIEQCLIYSLMIDTGEIRTYSTNGQVGCVVVEEDGNLLSAEQGGIYRIDPQSGKRSFLTQFLTDPEMRYNDGKLDPAGRFLVGTKGLLQDKPGRGQLISYSNQGIQSIINGTTISNGIGFSQQGDVLYFIDTPTRKVGKYFYNVENGNVVFDQYILEFQGTSYPDGMCVDIDDMIWVAEWGGGKVCKWNPKTGEKISEIKLPCTNVTSCCIGGDHNDYLFITTAKNKDLFEANAGGLFQIKIR